MSSSPAKPAVLIAHGAWHTPVHYQKLVDQLNAAGFLASCPRMPSSSNTIPPTHGMQDDSLAIRTELTSLADAGHPIILIMHSIGGANGSNALKNSSWTHRQAAGLGGGVVHLIYMAAFVFPVNTMSSTRFGGKLPPNLISNEADGTCSVRDPRQAFYNDLPKDEQDYYLSQLVACPSRIAFEELTYTPYGAGLQAGGEIDGGMGATYILCTEDTEFLLEHQEMSAEVLGPKCRKVRVKSGHSAMLSRTSDVVDIVKEAWETSKRDL